MALIKPALTPPPSPPLYCFRITAWKRANTFWNRWTMINSYRRFNLSSNTKCLLFCSHLSRTANFLANFMRLYDQSQWLPWSCAGPLSKNEPSVQTHNSIFSCQEIVKKVKNKINKNKKKSRSQEPCRVATKGVSPIATDFTVRRTATP